MLLTITTGHKPATDLGYFLHKHPDRLQSFELSFGQAHVFYPEANEHHCAACLLLDVDPVGMVRGKRRDGNSSFLLGQYVNDRPYVASSFMSVAISQVFDRVSLTIPFGENSNSIAKTKKKSQKQGVWQKSSVLNIDFLRFFSPPQFS